MPDAISSSGAGTSILPATAVMAEHGDGEQDELERDLHAPILPAGRRDGRIVLRQAVGSATQRIGSPQPRSSTPCVPRASATRVRRWAANVSTCAIMPP